MPQQTGLYAKSDKTFNYFYGFKIFFESFWLKKMTVACRWMETVLGTDYFNQFPETSVSKIKSKMQGESNGSDPWEEIKTDRSSSSD